MTSLITGFWISASSARALFYSRVMEAMKSINAVVFKAGGLAQLGLDSNDKFISLFDTFLFIPAGLHHHLPFDFQFLFLSE